MEEYSTFMRNGKPFTRKLIRNTTHDMSHTRIYTVWKGMRRRCKNPSCCGYKWYGGKGIKVCDEWDKPYGGFENFYKWAIENGYSDDLTIDRIDSDKDYCPENCRWITAHENCMKAVTKPHSPKFKYYALNEESKTLLTFYKAADFEEYTGIDSRRVSDGVKDISIVIKGWRFLRIPISEANTMEGQETILFRSTADDELLSEVRVIQI